MNAKDVKDSLRESKEAMILKNQKIKECEDGISGGWMIVLVCAILSIWSILSFVDESYDFWFVGKITLGVCVLVIIVELNTIGDWMKKEKELKTMSLSRFRHLYM